MTNLEARYRRLLRWYPAEHRAVYQEEMLGVLMDSAGPGRTRPGPAETADLLAGALAYRVRRFGRDLRGESWRGAGAVVAVVVPAVLLVGGVNAVVVRVAIGRYIYGGFPPPFGPSVWGPPLTWALVLVAALAGLRRLAAVLGWGGVLVETGHSALAYDRFGVLADPPVWTVMFAVAGALALTFAGDPGRVRQLLGTRRVVALAAIGGLFAAGPWLRFEFDLRTPTALHVWLEAFGWTSLVAMVVAVVLMLGVPRPVRRRLLAVLLMVLVVAVPHVVLTGWFPMSPYDHPGLVSALLVLLAPVVFVVGAVLARVGEGRKAARDEPGPPLRGQLP